MFQPETIPDGANLFRRVHQQFVRNGRPTPSAFRGGAEDRNIVSVDWDKYSTPDECRCRAPVPEVNMIVSLVATQTRSIDAIQVDHDPTDQNRAHSQIRGDLSVKTRTLLTEASSVLIPLA